MNDPDNKFKVAVGRIAACLLVSHIVLAAITLISPKPFIRSNPVTVWYSKLAIIGPFFSKDRIKSSYHLYVSVKGAGTWTEPRDYGTWAFRDYSVRPWLYSKLREQDLEGYLAWRVASPKKVVFTGGSKTFRELNRYVNGKLLKDTNADSIRLDYIRRTYRPDDKTFHIDTVFSYTYDPAGLE